MKHPWILLLNVVIVSTCGLVYELLAGTVASYVLGDSVTQFSLVIGLYLSALGVGAWLSKFLINNLASRFIETELIVGLIGGFSAPLLFLSFVNARYFSAALYSIVFIVGTLVGLEIPLLMRILKDKFEFKDLISRVLTFDYLGALIASILFPMVLVPKAGLIRTSLCVGLLNAAVALWTTHLLAPLIKNVFWLRVRGVIVVALLLAGLYRADWLTSLLEDGIYSNPVVYAKATPYQRIVVTSGGSGFQLFLNGHLQFNSMDEYRYHEALTHPAMLLHGAPKKVMILGGGDGLALREVLKYSSIEHVAFVDLDPEMTRLAADFPPLVALNNHSVGDSRVQVINQDAMVWLETAASDYDVAIVDFPDPSRYEISKLYTTRFYKLLKQRLSPKGAIAIQSTSPLYARTSFWCIVRTIEAAGLHAAPYQASVPSFGVWGFVLARAEPFVPENIQKFPPSMPLKFLDDPLLASLFVMGKDLGPVPVEINRLDNQVLVRYFDADWSKLE
jgi:spermidine synthase